MSTHLGVSQTHSRVRNPLCNVCVMPTQDLGPTGQRTAKNFTDLRHESGASLRALSAKLDELGRSIPPASLMKIEKGARRVDVDDLVALALALDVAPNRLLLTKEAGSGPVELTPGYTAPREEDAWRWACGEDRLPVPLGLSSMAEVLQFMAKSRPHHEVGDLATNEAEFREHREHLAPIAQAVRAAQENGVPFPTILNYLRMTDALRDAEDVHQRMTDVLSASDEA